MKSLELFRGVEIRGLGLFLRDSESLVFADVHLGYESELNKTGILVPMFQFSELAGQLKALLSETKPRQVIINGDLKHEFGTISRQEWREVLDFLDLLSGYDVKLVRGNHDTILGPIADRKGVEVVDHVSLGTTYVTHGHKIPDNKDFQKAKTVIIGHEHPAIGLREEGRVEKVKCFLKGRWEEKNLVVLPSFSSIGAGVDVLQEKLLSPFLQQDISAFEAYGVEAGEVMYFGRLKDLIAETGM